MTTPMPTPDDYEYMECAIEEAEKNMPNAPFGACLVELSTGDIVYRGANQGGQSGDPTAHGEMVVIQGYAKMMHEMNMTVNWTDIAIYTTGEPCPMCQSAIMWAGISKMVYASSIDALAKLGIGQILVYSPQIALLTNFGTGCAITGNVLANVTDPMFAEWWAMITG